MTSPDLIERTFALNAAYDNAGNTPQPGTGFNARRVCFYTGMQLEELAESLAAIADGEVEVGQRTRLAEFATLVKSMGKEFKSGRHEGAVLRADRKELLDGAIDSLVVAAGSLIYQTRHFRLAVQEVLQANERKITPVAIVDADGKWCKPHGWTKPDLTPYVEVPAD